MSLTPYVGSSPLGTLSMVGSWSSTFLSLQCARRKSRNNTRPHTLAVIMNRSKDTMIHSSGRSSGGFVVGSPSWHKSKSIQAQTRTFFKIVKPVQNISIHWGGEVLFWHYFWLEVKSTKKTFWQFALTDHKGEPVIIWRDALNPISTK